MEVDMAKRFICALEEPVVSTVAGKLRGYKMDEIYHFEGIRYAKAKRFRNPQKVTPWEGIKDATNYGPGCPVLRNPVPSGEVRIPHRFWPSNENCQYLNVWTSSLDTNARKAVMVWFHGGGFADGSAIEQVAYDGTNMAAYGDVVVVTVNHRLNVFGFLDLSDFGEKYANSKNAGLADLVAALMWVKENIAQFGGDPENVTIFGQSGGGRKVSSLGQIPAAKGLFHKGIVMSGVRGRALTRQDVPAKEFALSIMEELALTEEEVEKLETVSAQALIDATNAAIGKWMAQGKRIEWWPAANDFYLGEPKDAGFGEASMVPFLVGSVIGELGNSTPTKDKETYTEAEKRAVVAAKYGEENADRIMELFAKAYPGKNTVYAADIDVVFRPATIKYIKAKARQSTAPVYSYLFAPVFDVYGGSIAWHCSDLPFVFHNTTLIPVSQIDGVTQRLEQEIFASFINFAKTGNPNCSEIPEVKPCTEDKVYTIVYDEKTQVRENFDEELVTLAQRSAPPMNWNLMTVPEGDDEGGGPAWLY